MKAVGRRPPHDFCYAIEMVNEHDHNTVNMTSVHLSAKFKSMSYVLSKTCEEQKMVQAELSTSAKKLKELDAIHKKNLFAVAKKCDETLDASIGQSQHEENDLDLVCIISATWIGKDLADQNGIIDCLCDVMCALNQKIKAHEQKEAKEHLYFWR